MFERVKSRSIRKNSRGLSPVGILIGLVLAVIGLVVLLIGIIPGGSILGIATGTTALVMDTAGILVILFGGIIAWRF